MCKRTTSTGRAWDFFIFLLLLSGGLDSEIGVGTPGPAMGFVGRRGRRTAAQLHVVARPSPTPIPISITFEPAFSIARRMPDPLFGCLSAAAGRKPYSESEQSHAGSTALTSLVCTRP